MVGRSVTHTGLAARLAQIAGWRTATRDDAAVAFELHQTRAVDRVHSINEAAFFDELFCYIREIGAWPLLEALDPDHRSGPLYPFLQMVLFTIMRCVGGVQSMLATRDVLLTDERLMGLLGFNAVQVRAGANERGLSRRKKPVDVRGPFSFETVADNVVRIGPDRLATLVNGVVRCLATQGLFAKQLDVVLDATDDEATSKYKTDDGRDVPRVTREKRPDVRANRHAEKVAVTVFGWRVWLVWEPEKADEAKRQGKETGISRYRRELDAANNDRIAVFIGDRFGIFRTFELMLLLGVTVREREAVGESTQTVLERYGGPGTLQGSS